jgi:hypothetical protein
MVGCDIFATSCNSVKNEIRNVALSRKKFFVSTIPYISNRYLMIIRQKFKSFSGAVFLLFGLLFIFLKECRDSLNILARKSRDCPPLSASL